MVATIAVTLATHGITDYVTKVRVNSARTNKDTTATITCRRAPLVAVHVPDVNDAIWFARTIGAVDSTYLFLGFVTKVKYEDPHIILECADEGSVLRRLTVTDSWTTQHWHDIGYDLDDSLSGVVDWGLAGYPTELDATATYFAVDKETLRDAYTKIADATNTEFRYDSKAWSAGAGTWVEGLFFYSATAAGTAITLEAGKTSGNEIFGIPKWYVDDGELYNDVTVLYQGGSVNVTDATSIAAYGTRELILMRKDINNATDADNLADAIIAGYKDPRQMCECKIKQGLYTQTAGGFTHEVLPYYWQTRIDDDLNQKDVSGMDCESITLQWPERVDIATFGQRRMFTRGYLRNMETRLYNVEKSIDQDVLTTSSPTFASLTSTGAVSSSNQQIAPAFIIYKSGSNYIAKKGSDGSLAYTGTTAVTIIENALGALTGSRTWKEKVLIKDDVTLTTDIDVPNYSILEIHGKMTQTAATTCIDVSGAHDIDIIGGYLDCDGQGDGVYGINDCYNINVDGVKIIDANTAQQGIYLRGHDLTVQNCYVSVAGAGILCGRSEADEFTASNIKILNNYVYGTQDDGIAVDLVQDSLIQGNVVNRNNDGVDYSCGIKFFGDCDHLVIDGNVIYNCNDAATALHGIGNDIDSENNLSDGVVISNNIVHTCSAVGINVGGTADYHPTNTIISGNRIYDTNKGSYAYGADIRLYYSDKTLVDGNSFSTMYRESDTNTLVPPTNYGYNLPTIRLLGVNVTTGTPTLRHSHDAEASTASSDYVKLKTITFASGLGATYKVSYEIKTDPSGGGETAYGWVRPNGTEYGSPNSSVSGTYEEMSGDVTLSLGSGDTLELWARNVGGGTTYVQNFRVSYDPDLTAPSANS